MKTIELKEGQTARIIGRKIIIEEAFEPKDGDFVRNEDGDIIVFKSAGKDGRCYFHATCDEAVIYLPQNNESFYGFMKDIEGYATESEIQTLLDALDKKGLRWNAEEKRVEKKRWRAKMGGGYWRLSDRLTSAVSEESQHTIDNDRFKVGNYFQTKEEADAFAQKVRELYSQNLK